MEKTDDGWGFPVKSFHDLPTLMKEGARYIGRPAADWPKELLEKGWRPFVRDGVIWGVESPESARV